MVEEQTPSLFLDHFVSHLDQGGSMTTTTEFYETELLDLIDRHAETIESLERNLRAVRGELDDLNTRARLAGHFCADDAMAWIESRPDSMETLAKWHDEAHNGSRKFCDEEPCRSLIREGWSLSD